MGDVDRKKLILPDEYIPRWFKISPSMLYNLDSCGYKFAFQYVFGVSKAKKSLDLLLSSIISQAGSSEYERVQDLIESKDIMLTIISIVNHNFIQETGTQDEGIEEAKKVIQQSFDFPSPGNRKYYFTVDDFYNKCVTSAYLIRRFIDDSPLSACNDNYTNCKIDFPLIVNGEILDETNGKPTYATARVNFIDDRFYLYKWKADKSRSSDNKAETSNALLMCAAAVAHNFGFKDVNANLICAVTSKSGAEMETDHDISGLQEHTTIFTTDDFNELKRKLASDARRIKSMNLHKCKGWQCTNCEFRKVCIDGDSTGYVSKTDIWKGEADLSDDGPY